MSIAWPTQTGEAKPLGKWDDAISAFLAEKERRSGSTRTVEAYSATIRQFLGGMGKTPDQVTPPDVFAFAHGIGPSGRQPICCHDRRTARVRQ